MKLNKLNPNDCIGIFSSSSPTNKEALDNLIAYFTSKGYRCKVASHTLDATSFMAGTAINRVKDLHSLVEDTDIKLIMTSTGGGSAIQMLPYIDYSLIQNNPKIICGISDPTSIMNAITFKTSIPTFHGPNGYNFGHKVPSKFTEQNWWQMVTGNFEIPYKYPISTKAKVFNNSKDISKGKIYGGNLGVLSSLMGTPYFPDLKGCILLLEEVQKEFYKIDTFLTQLRLGGVFDKIVGLLFGENHECKDSSKVNPESFEDLLLRNFSEYNFPIFYDIPIGHTDDKLTIPLGCEIELNAKDNCISLTDSPF